MIRSSVRTAGLAILLTVNGCGALNSSGSGKGAPGLTVAEAALQGGSGQIALEVSEGVLHDSPNNIHAMEIKADALGLLGDYDQASAIFKALLAKDPNSIRANTGLGRIRLVKDPAGAEALFQLVLKRDPKDTTALNNVGIARDLQGHHAEAQTVYRQALAVNPDLDSAQVNLALSMAMSGQGPAAIKLLKDKASQPGTSAKIRHDYAVVLAMAGNRPEAERVLGDDLSPEEVRQVLDSVTGTHTRPVRDPVLASTPREDEVPPDVVQVPEVTAKPVAMNRTIPSNPATPAPARSATATGEAPAVQVRTITLATPAPMVVRPRPVAEPDSDTPVVQPVSPVAAAVTNQQSLALPIRGTVPDDPGTTPVEPAADPAIVVPAVVAMPPVPPVRQLAPAHDLAANVATTELPGAPPAPPVLRPLPLPPAYQIPHAAAHADPPAPIMASSSERPRAKAPPAESARTQSATPARPIVAAPSSPVATVVPLRPVIEAPRAAVATEANRAISPVRVARRNDTSPMVQFAAAPSEEIAHSFWQDLVHRFPEALGGREPVVLRFVLDGTVFWRVRTEGFDTLSEAMMLCARMRADGQDCFVPRS